MAQSRARVCAWTIIASVVAGVIGLVSEQASAVPSFARKYRTSCQTCHTQYPKLNPFGEAFRLSGYQYPDKDEDMQKGEPVELGAEKYKEVFPDAVWPSRIMDSVPFSARVQGQVKMFLADEAPIEDDFQYPANIILNLAGTLSEDIAMWAGLHISAAGTIQTTNVGFIFSNIADSVGVPRHLLNLKVGQFEPEAQPFSSHRSVFSSPSSFSSFSLVGWAQAAASGAATTLTTDHVHLVSAPFATARSPLTETGVGAISGGSILYGFDRGIELYGLIGPRFLYSIGVWNGNGVGAPVSATFDMDAGKDVATRLAYKLGGLGLDGSGDIDPKNWRERSATFGATFRYGNPKLTQTMEDGDVVSWKSASYRVGADLDLRYDDVQLLLAGAWQHASNPAGLGLDAAMYAWSSELHVVFLPWLQSTVRYEGVIAGKDWTMAAQNVTANLAFVIRPNLKASVEAFVDLRDTHAFSAANHALLLALDGAF